MRNRIPGRYFLKNLVERKTLVFQLVKRDFQQRYVGSMAGWLWGLIHPLVLLAIYTFIFDYCLGATPGPGEVTASYPLFLFSGMLPWLLFHETVQRSSGSIVEQANLITKTVFPAEIMPISIFLSSLVSHLLAVGLFLIVVGMNGHLPGPAVALLPVSMLLLGLFSVGIGWIVASMQVYLRDSAQVVIVMLTLWYWMTPIMISEAKFRGTERFPRAVHAVLVVNPLAYVVRAYRQMLLGGAVPWRDVGIAAAFSCAVFILGGLFFRHMKRGFADVL